MISRERIKELQEENDTSFYGLTKDSANELIYELTALLDELERNKVSE